MDYSTEQIVISFARNSPIGVHQVNPGDFNCALPLAKLVSACSVLVSCSGLNKQIDFVLYLFLTGVRKVTEHSDTSMPIGCTCVCWFGHLMPL